jgi:hypothetical protein
MRRVVMMKGAKRGRDTQRERSTRQRTNHSGRCRTPGRYRRLRHVTVLQRKNAA